MPTSQSKASQASSTSRSNRGPRAGKSGSTPGGRRSATSSQSTRARNRASREGNAANPDMTRSGQRPQVAAASGGRGRGDGSRRALPTPETGIDDASRDQPRSPQGHEAQGGRGAPNAAPFEEMTVSAHEDAEAWPAAADRVEANARRESKDDALAVGRPSGRFIADEGDPSSREWRQSRPGGPSAGKGEEE